MKYPEIARRFDYILTLRKMSAQELANKSGVGKSSISHYVNGSNEPSAKNAEPLAKVLHVNFKWLMGFDVPMELLLDFNGEPAKVVLAPNADFVRKIDKLSLHMSKEDMDHILSYTEWFKENSKNKEE